MKTVIMAGGKGTRISSLAADIPKPMIKIKGKPILEYQIESLSKQGSDEFIFIIGHLGNIIEEYFGNGSKWNVCIEYIQEKYPLGTAGALYYLKDKIKEDFLLINGDIIFDVDINRFYKYHMEKKGWATILTHPNSHPYDSGLIITDNNNKVIQWVHKEQSRINYKNRVNAGIHLLSPNVFELFNEEKKVDLDREILQAMISEELLYAYDSPEYVKDMGTPDRYKRVCTDLENGFVQLKNLKNKQRAVFLDRDGTLNIYKGFISKVQDIELIEGVSEAVKIINESGYLAIVITNQPVIARGECGWQELNAINNKVEMLLGEKGAYLDDIFVCPHHPDKGFAGEQLEYKIDCECRKPKPGLLFKAAQKYNIDLDQSYMVGDHLRDYNAGTMAGCKSVILAAKDSFAQESCDSLLEFVNKFIVK